MNAVAGGGAFVVVPTLIFSGVSPIIANATSNTALWFGVLGGARGFRREIFAHRRLLPRLLVVSICGAIIGALLLLLTPPIFFQRLLPWLLLFAVLLFSFSGRLTKRAFEHPHQAHWQLLAQFLVAIYGGYFGGGQGILMLAILAFSGLPSLSAANGIKNLLSVAINGVAIIPFAIAHIIDWPLALMMAISAPIGGYLGAKAFRHVPTPIARGIIIAIGASMTIALFLRA